MTIPYPIIHINGFPGTGKLTIAIALAALLPTTTKLVHNHLLINPADAILTRSQSGYQDLRRAIRSAVFQSLIHEPATYETAYIFTDFQSTDAVGSGVCKEFEAAANARGGAFVPILLRCEERVNLERLVSEDRAKHRKLTDVDLSTDAVGSGVCKEFEAAANARGGAFVPILLRCEERVNLERLVSEDRAKHRKLTDVDLVRVFQFFVSLLISGVGSLEQDSYLKQLPRHSDISMMIDNS
ncbi:uncharacterized protein PAC_09302 [Phialocephala subalpina]|uniref:Uncharacterized protein n=1 Tax=Phialocephala subalpina TaxID=576137 RepID=A0A1L7X302_9HELO|nr:uncharacterized protein PAC_09302 [Phialocephala subalpina]